MAERKYTHGLRLSVQDAVTVLEIGDMEIWDGADLSLLRDTIVRLVYDENATSVGVDMSCVQHVPSGFFGMLFDWHERGISIRLMQPRERVKQMLWFRKFFIEQKETVFMLYDGEGINEDVSEDLWMETRLEDEVRFPLITTSH
ncbi:hypothetical protein [Thalassoglobus polymorphus]|uniref:STAS domain-containing protein n=1 Tax=Thalassoglobus polymorphus TaxID=2527994 RepID=A0A517QRH5_9PLAN|nr:hypothetical protein [Thalassoglobus polymorphus]QDT34234.1 hypothetical protein Mal48_34940 [Thalassoglobus polymorphus]